MCYSEELKSFTQSLHVFTVANHDQNVQSFPTLDGASAYLSRQCGLRRCTAQCLLLTLIALEICEDH